VTLEEVVRHALIDESLIIPRPGNGYEITVNQLYNSFLVLERSPEKPGLLVKLPLGVRRLFCSTPCGGFECHMAFSSAVLINQMRLPIELRHILLKAIREPNMILQQKTRLNKNI
jgi:hypothetical protein